MSARQSLPQLRAALETLQSYELPERYRVRQEGTDGDGEDAVRRRPLLTKEMISRYHAARNAYLRHRIQSLFIEHLPTYDPASNTFAFPPAPTPEEEEDLRLRSESVRSDLIRTAAEVDGRVRNLRSKHEALESRREELRRLVGELEEAEEKKAGAMGSGSDAEMSDEGSVGSGASVGSVGEGGDGGEIAAQEQRLEGLIHKRNELEARLRSIRAQTAEEEEKFEQAREMMAEARRKAGRGGGGGKSVLPENVLGVGEGQSSVDRDGDKDEDKDDDDLDVEELEKEAAEIRAKAAEYREMAEFYDSMREVVEQLGGVRILSVEDVQSSSSSEGADGCSEELSSRGDDTTGSLSELLRRSRRDGGDSNDSADVVGQEVLSLKVEILGRHVLRIGLGHGPLPAIRSAGSFAGAGAGAGGETLRAVSARFVTDPVITDAMVHMEEEMEATVSLPIPAPSDLLRISRSLPPAESVRFLVRECSARIRATSARVTELAKLRMSCMTKIYPQSSEDGLEQQVVCSMRDGVTAVLRLSADCPLIPGSVRIEQVVGVGGWDRDALEGTKERVNQRMARSPLEIVEELRNELDRVTGRGGEGGAAVRVPETPKLPERRGK